MLAANAASHPFATSPTRTSDSDRAAKRLTTIEAYTAPAYKVLAAPDRAIVTTARAIDANRCVAVNVLSYRVDTLGTRRDCAARHAAIRHHNNAW